MPKWARNFIFLLKASISLITSVLLNIGFAGIKFSPYPRSLYSASVNGLFDRFTTCPEGSRECLVEWRIWFRSFLRFP